MKSLSPEAKKTTIFLPPEVLITLKGKAKGAGVSMDTWLLFSLLKSFKDESFSWDLRQSEAYLDHQLEL
jgi:hypothetical protein